MTNAKRIDGLKVILQQVSRLKEVLFDLAVYLGQGVAYRFAIAYLAA